MDELALVTWKADKYRINSGEDLPRMSVPYEKQLINPCIEATPNARWKQLNPFDLYSPSKGGRDAKPGPHLTFLRLKELAREKPHLLETGITMFAEEYGLLGAFQRSYLPRPVVRWGKSFIAPEAMVDGSGVLRKVDPATEGTVRLLALRREKKRLAEFLKKYPENPLCSLVALPDEVRLIAPHGRGTSGKVVPWPKIRQELGALLVLTPSGDLSPLCFREPLRLWQRALDEFPEPQEAAAGGPTRLYGVRPVFAPSADGYLSPGWECDSLLSAMHLMLYLDLSNESTIRKCQSRGCPGYFRSGPHSKESKYCSQKCASCASTRRSRGQEP